MDKLLLMHDDGGNADYQICYDHLFSKVGYAVHTEKEKVCSQVL